MASRNQLQSGIPHRRIADPHFKRLSVKYYILWDTQRSFRERAKFLKEKYRDQVYLEVYFELDRRQVISTG